MITAQEVIDVIALNFAVNAARLNEATSLEQGKLPLDFDEIDAVELEIAIEERFEKWLPDDDDAYKTIGELTELLNKCPDW